MHVIQRISFLKGFNSLVAVDRVAKWLEVFTTEHATADFPLKLPLKKGISAVCGYPSINERGLVENGLFFYYF